MASCNNNFISGKIAIVTGSSSGIGLASVKSLLNNGIKSVVMLSIDDPQNVENEIKCLQGKFNNSSVCYMKCDVTNFDDMKNAFETTIKKFGTINILVNNAGIFNERDWNKMIDINLKGSITGTQLALKYMSKENGGQGGTIVNIVSILGFTSMSVAPVYTATKHAMIGYTKAMAEPFNFQKSGVRFMALCPGLTNTELTQQTKKLATSSNTDPALDEWYRIVSGEPWQDPKYPGECLIKMLNEGENGSMWISDNEENYQVIYPEFATLEKI